MWKSVRKMIVVHATCKFICDLRYLYIENILNEVPGVENLQKYCRNNYDFFHVIITFLNAISEMEKEKIKLQIKQKELIEKWSANTP